MHVLHKKDAAAQSAGLLIIPTGNLPSAAAQRPIIIYELK